MRKLIKKTKKKLVKAAQKAVKPIKAKKEVAQGKPAGAVTHYFAQIKVAIIKFKQRVKVGTEILVQGATTDFKHKIVSMQYDHKPVVVAKKGQEVGIKVAKRVREGDAVYLM